MKDPIKVLKKEYNALKKECQQWVSTVIYPTRRSMHYYPKKDNYSPMTYNLLDLYHKVEAANTLGYDVRLISKDDGLHVEYVKRPGPKPWGLIG